MGILTDAISIFFDFYQILYVQIILVPLVMVSFLNILAYLYKIGKISSLTARTVAHTTIGLVAVLLANYSYGFIFMAIGLFNGTKHFLTKPDYLYAIESKRDSWGVWVYSYTFAILSIIGLPYFIIAFQISILILSISDPSAMILGCKYPIYKIKITGKSLGGSVGFMIASVVTLVLFSMIIGFFSASNFFLFVIISFIGAFFEQISPKGLDNATVPIIIFILSIILF